MIELNPVDSRSLKKFPLWFFLPLFLINCADQETDFVFDTSSEQINFGVSQLKKALVDDPSLVAQYQKFSFAEFDGSAEEGGYDIQVDRGNVHILGKDENELMYAGLEIAEQLDLNKKITDTRHTPYLRKRGIKMNIPLDARTPSYDDTGDAAQQNIKHMWDWSFWQEYLDALAINRFNVLTLWNPHPFPSMVKLEKYPDVALDDICMTILEPIGVENEWAEPQMVSRNVIENLDTIKKITIDEKIAFWQRVMDYAAHRGIEIYFFTWNLCANAAANPVPPNYRTYEQPLWDEEPGKYGITNQMNNPINVDYYRESVKTFLNIYPKVKGIGVTAGEHMLDEAGGYTREQWIWEAYGQGILDAQEQDPNREVRFIHRVWNTDMDKIMEYWQEYPGLFEASFKYARARLYSTPTPDFAEGHIESMQQYGLKSWWNLRNDDIFVHRWGNPDYVRNFINYLDKDHTAGFYMGSDGYVWGRDFNSKDPVFADDLEMHKHWYKFMLWGRLAYNNILDSTFFIQKIKERYPEADGEELYQGWKVASEIIPAVNRFHWNNWDYQWSVEACIDARIGFHDVLRFMTNPTLPEGNILNPEEFAKRQLDGSQNGIIIPEEVTSHIRSSATLTQKLVVELRKDDNSSELAVLLDDLESMSFLGQYYADKIEAAVELTLFKENKDIQHQNRAVVLLEECVNHWKAYASLVDKNYRPQMLARTKNFDVHEILREVEKDVSKAKEFTP